MSKQSLEETVKLRNTSAYVSKVSVLRIQRALANRLLGEGQSAKQVAKVFGVHVSTIYRFVETYSA